MRMFLFYWILAPFDSPIHNNHLLHDMLSFTQSRSRNIERREPSPPTTTTLYLPVDTFIMESGSLHATSELW